MTVAEILNPGNELNFYKTVYSTRNKKFFANKTNYTPSQLNI